MSRLPTTSSRPVLHVATPEAPPHVARRATAPADRHFAASQIVVFGSRAGGRGGFAVDDAALAFNSLPRYPSALRAGGHDAGPNRVDRAVIGAHPHPDLDLLGSPGVPLDHVFDLNCRQT
jgi:hypothetical protein